MKGDFHSVRTALDALGRMRPDALVFDCVQARHLHHELSVVPGIADHALETLAPPIDFAEAQLPPGAR